MLKACGNRIIVRLPNVTEVASPGGIVLPTKQQGIACGEAVSVGEGRTNTESKPCADGDLVYFKRHEHETVIDKNDEEIFIVLEFGQILAVKE